MQDDITDRELHERLTLIERMIAEGRRTTENWGWTFVLWGGVYYAAIAWSAWEHSVWSWPVTILIGIIATVLIGSLKGGHDPGTNLGLAIGSLWLALGISMCVLFPALSLSGRLTDQHLFMAVISVMLGMANGASALILRWKAQLACAIVWWIAAASTCFGSDNQSLTVFLVAIFVCQIVFGIYGMIAGGQKRRQRVPGNA